MLVKVNVKLLIENLTLLVALVCLTLLIDNLTLLVEPISQCNILAIRL